MGCRQPQPTGFKQAPREDPMAKFSIGSLVHVVADDGRSTKSNAVRRMTCCFLFCSVLKPPESSCVCRQSNATKWQGHQGEVTGKDHGFVRVQFEGEPKPVAMRHGCGLLLGFFSAFPCADPCGCRGRHLVVVEQREGSTRPTGPAPRKPRTPSAADQASNSSPSASAATAPESTHDQALIGLVPGGAAEASARPGRGTPGRERKMSRRFVECLESIAS